VNCAAGKIDCNTYAGSPDRPAAESAA